MATRKQSVIYAVFKSIYRRWIKSSSNFPGSKNYWIDRYKSGGNSGCGSYNKLAEFKAEILNDFVSRNNVSSVIEFGCGDGNQLRLAHYPSYLGFDISENAVSICRELFTDDTSKTFLLIDEYQRQKAELALSLDVIYHLVEEHVFNDYMKRLFSAAERYVIIYSSNTNKQISNRAGHVRHRLFTKWVEKEEPDWELVNHIPNRYPYKGDDTSGSFSDFYVFSHK